MTALRLSLVALPCALVLVLLQAFAWIPSYQTQGRDNPSRLHAFVEAAAGDARLLNPILHADTASGRIVDLVFDGLLRSDERLELEGALAQRWRVTETARLGVRDDALAEAVLPRVQAALERLAPDLLLEPVRVIPRGARMAHDDDTRSAWPRLEMRLARVVPDLEAVLHDALGEDYGAGLPPRGGEDDDPVLEHNPEITFWLRRDAVFHDGHPFDAADVVFTYDAIVDPRNLSPRRSSFEPVKSVVALDAHTVRVTYKRLFSPAVNVWTIGMLPEHLLDEDAMRAEMDRRGLGPDARESFGLRDSEFNRAPIGTGPFRFRSWSSDELIHLSRNARYWDGAPAYREYYYRVLPDALTQEIEFRAGSVDTYVAEPHQAARYREDDRYRAFSSVTPGYTYIGYNLRRAPFDDADVRRALGMAIDVDAIIRYALFGEAERVTGPYASITDWYDHSVPALTYDPEAALALLERRGWRRGADGWLEKDGKRLEFNLITNNGNLRRKAVASIVQQSWQRIGVKCNVQLFEWAVFLKDFVNPGAFDAVVLGWRLDLDPDLHQIWHSSQTDPNELNFIGFTDSRSDELIEALRREYDRAEQVRLAHALHRRIAALQPYTFLFAPRATRMLDRKIVMRGDDGEPVPVRAGGAGNLYFHFNRWQRLDHDPGF